MKVTNQFLERRILISPNEKSRRQPSAPDQGSLIFDKGVGLSAQQQQW
jgi:hypothetical protein